MKNANFNAVLTESGMSMYALSRDSGVPYTTISEIHRGKNDINQCAAGTVQRLAAILGVTAGDLLNEINYLDGVKGRYKGIDYVWSSDEISQITFCYEEKDVTISTGKKYNIPSRAEYYRVVAGWMIKEYIDKEQWRKEARAKIERLGLNE